MFKKILIILLAICLVIPCGVAFAEEGDIPSDYSGGILGSIPEEHNVMLTANSQKEGTILSLHQTVSYHYDEVKEFDLDFKTQQEYFNWQYNHDGDRQSCGTYEVTLYQDGVALVIREAYNYIIHANGHTFTYIDESGNPINQITVCNDGPRLFTIYNGTLNSDVSYTMKEGGFLTLVDSVLDGKNQSVRSNLFTVYTYGGLYLENSSIKNIRLTNGAELVAFSADGANSPAYFESKSDSALIENIHSDGSGIICLDEYYARITNIEFNNISSFGKGGCIYFKNGNITGCKFKNCSSDDNGGAIYMNCSISGYIYSCTFENCHSLEKGGAIYDDGEYSSCKINGCTFEKCSAEDHGGAIYIYANNAMIEECNFYENSTEEDGGAIYLDASNCDVDSCYFYGNESGVDGGALCIDEDDNFIYRCSFHDNHACDDGGAAYLTTGTDDIVFQKCTFGTNYADDDCDDVDDNSDTEFIDCGSTVSKGNAWLIICIVEALAIVVLALVILNKKQVKK